MKKIVKSLFKSISIVVIFTVLLCIKTYNLYDLSGFKDSYSINTILMTILLSMIIFSLGILFKSDKKQLIYSIIMSTILGLLLFGNRIFFTYNKTFLSLFQIKSIFYANEIGSAMKSFYKINDIFFFIDTFIFIAITIISKVSYMFRKNTKRNKENTSISLHVKNSNRLIKQSKTVAILTYILLLLIGLLGFLNSVLVVDEADAATSHGRVKLMKEKSIWDYYFQDSKLFFKRDSSSNFIEKNKMQEYFNALNKEKKELDKDTYVDITNLAEGKDIYILQLESFQNFLINKKINGKEITPNLNKFAKENIYFSNFHSQSCVSNTSDAEHASSTSLYPFINYSLYQFYDSYKSENIYSLAKEKDYYTSFMHANVGYFWNRKNVYTNMGVEKLEFIDSYKDNSQYIHNWIADYNFLQENVDKIKSYPKDKNKFVYMTLVSSHLPFDLNDLEEKKSQFVDIDVGEYKDTVYGNYLESANYVDKAFGAFLERLESENMLNNSIILVYGDHFGIPRDNVEYREDMLLNNTLDNIDYNHTNVPCIMKIEGINGLEIKEAKSQLDIKPTIAKLLDVEDKYSFGTNLFTKKNEVIFATGNYIFENKFYVSSNNQIRDLTTKEIIKITDMDKESMEYLEHKKQINKIELEKLISGTIVKTNYLGKMK